MKQQSPEEPLQRSVSNRFDQGIRAVTAFLILVALTNIADACNIPVFRYALERWKPDPVEFVIFSNGDLPSDAAAKLQRLSELSNRTDAGLNAKLIPIDVTSPMDEPYDSLWTKLKKDVTSMPYLVVRTKVGRGRTANHVHRPLREVDLDGMIRSTVRDELRRRLLAGHSVVWLLVQSPDTAKNTAASTLLRNSFQALQSSIKLPEGIGLPGSELYADVPLVMRYSILEIDPADQKDPYLADLLTSLRPEAWRQNEPLLVPVFGRGRALEVLSAETVTPTMVKELTAFLTGACSCQVKEQNPGFDLLIHCEWDAELFGGVENRPPDRSNVEGTNRPPTLVPIPPGRK